MLRIIALRVMGIYYRENSGFRYYDGHRGRSGVA